MIKQILGLITAAMLFVACQKNSQPSPAAWENYLVTHLSSFDFDQLDKSTLRENDRIIRLNLVERKEMIVLAKAADGSITGGKILQVTGSIDEKGYQGSIVVRSLDRSDSIHSMIQNGFILSAHQTYTINAATTQRTTAVECKDCTIPEVIVTASYANSYDYDPYVWINLYWLLGGDMPKSEYMPLDGGVGGGGGASASFDEEMADDKERIDPKKYMDCFGTIPDAGATCTITISADIPVDGHPELFVNFGGRSVGHAFIELYKADNTGRTITQHIGFYPNTDYKSLSGLGIESKVVNNANHEYNVRYTMAVTPAQLQAAINMVNTAANNQYNLATYNCTDFALSVFNATGANLRIPKYQIPGYNVSGGSNTPQGLYQKLMDMAVAGNTGVQTNGAKGYVGNSHGPCN